MDACDRFGALGAVEAQEWALAEGDEARRGYYEGRLQSFGPHEGIVLSRIAALARDNNGRLAWNAAARIASEADVDAAGRRLLASAIEKGVLSLVESSTQLAFAVPWQMEHLAKRVEEA